jgi:amidase
LKDNFNVVGYDSTVGFASLVGKPATYNATLVELLEKLGAVRYCKTNVPTAMMIVGNNIILLYTQLISSRLRRSTMCSAEQ